jgi:flavin-dependent dehydrogenase
VNRIDAAVIGGGPAGSTVGTLLARQGLAVTLFEKKSFPRFHIGESLLPASLAIFEELGVHEKIKQKFIKKPGGKWYYGDKAVLSDFSAGPEDTSFAPNPHAYMVRRAEFDDLLLQNAASNGVRVLEHHSVVDVIQEGERVKGVVVKDPQGATQQYESDMVFDCSGFGAVIPTKFQLRKENRLKRMAVFGHYRCTSLNDDVNKGWFVGQMVYNGWIWMIPLAPDLISIGMVIPLEKFKTANQLPQEFLESYMRKMPVVKAGLSPNPQLEGKVHIYGNLGYTTSRAYGDGWALVGDAAFFIDPCYSSGVHLALTMAKDAANLYLESRRSGKRPVELFVNYEKALRRDEVLMLRFVDSFYMASRNRVLKWLVPATLTEALNRQFVSVTGGEFARHPFMVNWVYWSSTIVSFLFPFRATE